MKKMMLDLCAGFGGQSEAFHLGNWDVLRIDNNPLLKEVPRMVLADLYEIEVFNNSEHRIEYVHAGPTCLEFSTAFSSPRGLHQRGGSTEEYDPKEGIKLVQRCKDIIDILKPRYWSIENVKGSIKYLTPILGEPRLIVGAWVYWGNFPLFDTSVLTIPNKSTQDRRHSPLRMNYRAHIPLCVSQAFLKAMDEQQSITDY